MSLRRSSPLAVLCAVVLGLVAAAAPASADVADVPAPSGALLSFSPVEASPYIGDVAHFAGIRAQPTATIDWGDGTPPATANATLAAPDEYDVKGVHTYAKLGTYAVKVTLSWTDPNLGPRTLQVSGQRQVRDAPLTPNGKIFTHTGANVGFSGVVGEFTDANPNPDADEFSGPTAVVIDWGDGTESFGTAVRKPGFRGRGTTFEIHGSHTWKTAGEFRVFALITAKGGSTARVSSVASVYGAPTADFTSSQYACANRPLTFDASKSAGTAKIAKYEWTFADTGSPFGGAVRKVVSDTPVTVQQWDWNRKQIDLNSGKPVRFWRDPVDVTLKVTDVTGITKQISRRIVFVDYDFTPSAGNPHHPLCKRPLSQLFILKRYHRFIDLVVGGSGGSGGSGRGTSVVQLGCARIAQCLAQVELVRGRVVLARGAARIAAGAQRSVAVRVTPAGRRLLGARDDLSAQLRVLTTSAGGAADVERRAVTVS